MHSEASDSKKNSWVNLLCVYSRMDTEDGPDSWDNGQCINTAQEPWVYIRRLFLFLLPLVGRVVFLNCVLNAHNVSQVLFWICHSSCWTANLMISKRWFSNAFSSWDTLLQVYFWWITAPKSPLPPSLPFLCSSALFPFLSACTSLSSRSPQPPPRPPSCDLQAQVPVVVSCWLQQVVGRPQY